MAPHQRKFYDLNVPLAPSSTAAPSSASRTRKQLARIVQTRLHQLGYSSLAFCHTAYGRADAKKDDADAALPWRDLLPDSSTAEHPESNARRLGVDEPRANDDPSGSFGRKNALGMTIYRRINIVLEDVGDVSRLLFPSQSASSDDPSTLPLDEISRKYDIVSLQPMNEPAFQNICEFVASSANGIDILVLEYATGSRGGYGLPYRLRKDSLAKTMEAGVALELCYASAAMDPKRRQGFLRTLVEFRSCYNSVQKKHGLLSKHLADRRLDGERCRSELFPLVISSGSRQNYSEGTDEGVLALRTPKDVQFLAGYTMGGNAWAEKNEYFEETGDKKRRRIALSAAEKVLERARDRSFGVLTRPSIAGNQKKRRTGVHSNSSIRAHVRVISTSNNREKIIRDEKDESDDSSVEDCSKNLLEWLSEPIKMKTDCEPTETAENNQHDTVKCNEVSTREENASQDEEIDEGFEHDDDDEDLEDGFLAL